MILTKLVSASCFDCVCFVVALHRLITRWVVLVLALSLLSGVYPTLCASWYLILTMLCASWEVVAQQAGYFWTDPDIHYYVTLLFVLKAFSPISIWFGWFDRCSGVGAECAQWVLTLIG